MFEWHAECIPERDCWSVFDAAGFPVAVELSEEKARLIAAAPDLLAAGIEEVTFGRHRWPRSGHETNLWKAVAKARPRTV